MADLVKKDGQIIIEFDQEESLHIEDQLEELGIKFPLAKAKVQDLDILEIDVNRNLFGFTSLKDIILSDGFNLM